MIINIIMKMMKILLILLLLYNTECFISNKIMKKNTNSNSICCINNNNNIYKRYLSDIKKTKKILSKINETSTKTLLRYINNENDSEEIIENKKIKIKKIKIDDNLILNVENCEKIIIKSKNNKLEIEINENENDDNIIKKSVKELDIMITLLSVLDLLLNSNK